jgi:2-C-methyl-D-erythritol 4-phosphate cytidylyltransferase
MKVHVIIPAGGKGLRSGFSVPKQYLKINGRELIAYTLKTFQNCRSVDDVTISADPFYVNQLKKIKQKHKLSKVKSIVEGGKERQDSVYNALKLLKADADDLVCVHDAARALLSKDVLQNAINLAKKKGNALVCIKAKDTLLKGNSVVKEYLDREEIYYVQTPQIFRYDILMKAFNKSYDEVYYGTDESMLVKRTGEEIFIAEGSASNFKITSKEDIKLFRMLVKTSAR